MYIFTNSIDQKFYSWRRPHLPVNVGDVGIGDDDTVAASLQAAGQPERVEVVLVDDVPDSHLPKQLLPPQARGGANARAKGNVGILRRRLALAILQQVRLRGRGHGSGRDVGLE